MHKLHSQTKRLLGYLIDLGRIRHEVFPFQRTLAHRFKVCVRTIRRWLAELVEKGCLSIQRRGPRSALYLLAVPAGMSAQNVRSFEPHPFTDIKRYTDPPPTSSHVESRRVDDDRPVTPDEWTSLTQEPPVTALTPQPPRLALVPSSDPAFEDYIGVFLAAGKELSPRDIAFARTEWCRMPIQEREAACAHILPHARQTETRFIPMPVNHLRARPWERRGMNRVLEYFKPIERMNKRARSTANFLRRWLNEETQNGTN